MKTIVGKRYTRKYANGEPVSHEDLASAFEQAAQLVVEHGDEFLPLFERLDQELQQRNEQEAARERTKEVVRKGASVRSVRQDLDA